ncbi:hypothetical protein Q73A0000_05865 [Kaistella flava (ex Peng et al. 2021)]|uniref:Uncharacterized protein n=1 Tax=Kaistella flava (ex Peng et al. 2021) TaxID=2038776 RepID=A0A7M2Y753_9FLAO|nr:hypothetical protein [Kaistella flava (ex Peng et al. 2021)]QOW09920.1 hypothetical protein Q73A0000_05865 [Kaistella flava (ex Peng et al. 2021)]
MIKLVHNNSTIECLSAKVISRKIMPGSFIDLPNIGKCFSYKCSRNSEAKILKELTPRAAIVNEFSGLELDTILECENLYVAVTATKPYKLDVINHSGRHKARTFESKEFTFAKVILQHHNIKFLVPEKEIKYLPKRID